MQTGKRIVPGIAAGQMQIVISPFNRSVFCTAIVSRTVPRAGDDAPILNEDHRPRREPPIVEWSGRDSALLASVIR